MGIALHWLSWDQPVLRQAASWLVQRGGVQSPQAASPKSQVSSHQFRAACDLRNVICVVQGSRAGRLLLAELIRECKERGVELVPPRVHTPGSLVASLSADQPIASDVEVELAWSSALRGANRETIAPLLPVAPADDDVMAWQSLAETIAKIHADLAGGLRSFSDVAELAERMEMLAEGDRWRALENVCKDYQKNLRSQGLLDPHRTREEAINRISKSREFAAEQVVLIAAPELNALQRNLIGAIADRVAVLIHAPQEISDHFDDLGCVISDAWAEARIAIRDDQIISADRPEDQAQHALRAIAKLDGQFSAAEITIGLGDGSLAPALDHAAQWANLTVRNAGGLPLRDTPPARALAAIADYLSEPRFATFAAIIRHPDIENWVQQQTRHAGANVYDWLTVLDQYFADFLDERFAGDWLGNEKTRTRLKAVHDAAMKLLAPLNSNAQHSSSSSAQTVFQSWARPILQVLAGLYGDLDEQPRTPANALRVQACLKIRDAVAEIESAAAGFQPRMNAAQAISLLLNRIAGVSLPQTENSEAIEMLGWLELHSDPAPVLIATGFNEGKIPASATSDPFLPDSLRSKLGLPCNATRYARDAYLLSAILRSRPHVTLIAGRRSERGEALTPSRLLLACDDDQLAARVQKLCNDQSAAARVHPVGMNGGAAGGSRFIVPPLPRPLVVPDAMSVTEFRAYLACPYRYALAKLLKLESIDDSACELDPLKFGTLAHDILRAFGNDAEISVSDQPEKIEKFLIGELRKATPAMFGASPAAAVRVQLARMEQRLAAFAHLQAKLCREGWRIRHCEVPFGKDDVPLDMPGETAMPLNGKIDRIDFNEGDGSWRIIDYKTSENGDSPHKTHTGREKCDAIEPEDWRDLQLPLYRFLALRSKYGISGKVELSYICLPKQADATDLKLAQWTQEQLEQAVDVAREVVRRIRAQQFDLNKDFDGFDDFARICQTTTYNEIEDQAQQVEA